MEEPPAEPAQRKACRDKTKPRGDDKFGWCCGCQKYPKPKAGCSFKNKRKAENVADVSSFRSARQRSSVEKFCPPVKLRDWTKPLDEFATPLCKVTSGAPLIVASLAKQTTTKPEDTKMQKLDKLNKRNMLHVAALQQENKKQKRQIAELQATVNDNEKLLLQLNATCKRLRHSTANTQRKRTMNDSTLADFTKGKCILDKDDKAGLAQQTRSDIVKRIVKEMIVSSHGSLLSATEIFDGVVRHKWMRQVVQNSGELENDDEAKDLLLRRLSDALRLLCKSARTIEEYQANQVRSHEM